MIVAVLIINNATVFMWIIIIIIDKNGDRHNNGDDKDDDNSIAVVLLFFYICRRHLKLLIKNCLPIDGLFRMYNKKYFITFTFSTLYRHNIGTKSWRRWPQNVFILQEMMRMIFTLVLMWTMSCKYVLCIFVLDFLLGLSCISFRVYFTVFWI